MNYWQSWEGRKSEGLMETCHAGGVSILFHALKATGKTTGQCTSLYYLMSAANSIVEMSIESKT